MASLASGRIFVGGANVKEHDLQQLFGKYGNILKTMIRADYSFVELEDKREAERAIKELNGMRWEGRNLRVEPANQPGQSRKDLGEDKGNCFACGKPGHWSRECPSSSSRDKKACFNCGKVGHMARECRSAKTERGGRGDRDRDYRDRDRDRDYRDDRSNRDRYRDERDAPPRAYYDDPRGPPSRDEYADRGYSSYNGYGRGRSRSPARFGGRPPSPPRSPPRSQYSSSYGTSAYSSRGRSPVRDSRDYARVPSPTRPRSPPFRTEPRPYSPGRTYGEPGRSGYGRY